MATKPNTFRPPILGRSPATGRLVFKPVGASKSAISDKQIADAIRHARAID